MVSGIKQADNGGMMKVRTLGFQLEPIGYGTIEALAERILEKSGEEFSLKDYDRRLYCITTNLEEEDDDGETAADDEYLVGVLLTIRDHKKFIQLTENNGSIDITITELDDDSSPFDFNFFILHLPSGSGLYSHYHYSCSFNSFHFYLKDQFLRAGKELREGKVIDDKEKVRASKKNNLKYSLFHRRDSFEDAVKQLSEVKRFEYDILVPESMTEQFVPLRKKLKLERRSLRFEANLSGSSFWGKLKKMLPESLKPSQRFRVVGKDDDGSNIPIDFLAPPEHFHEDEFDNLANNETLMLNDISESVHIQKLLHIFSQNQELFTAFIDD